ncbi:hypothetical protein F4802DRAFT_572720 [Xylaria palmicola]|nr:hypothetical protein F4802DRAFT_572720 [Xylaria palmicola]
MQVVSTCTTAYALTNIINVCGSNYRADFVTGLRSECDQVADRSRLSANEDINQLHRVNSTVCDSLQVSPFAVIAPLKMTSRDKILNMVDGIQLLVPSGAL